MVRRVVPERPRRSPEDPTDAPPERPPGPSRGRREPPLVGKGTDLGDEPLVRRGCGLQRLRGRPSRLALHLCAVERVETGIPDRDVAGRRFPTSPCVDRVEHVLLPALEVSDQILRGPVAVTKAPGGDSARGEPLGQFQRRTTLPLEDPYRFRSCRNGLGHEAGCYPLPQTSAATSSGTSTSVSSATSGSSSPGYRMVAFASATSPPTATTVAPRSRIQPIASSSNPDPTKSMAR